MCYDGFRARPAAPDTHSFVTDIVVAPGAFDDFEWAMEDRSDVKLLCRIGRPSAWVVHAA